MPDFDPSHEPHALDSAFGQVDPLARTVPLAGTAGKLARARNAAGAVFFRSRDAVVGYFANNDPSFANAFAPALFVAALLYVRSPTTNCIFDEQEALLANPYVNGVDLRFIDAFRRDFWGLPSTRSIGSYRPLPNLIWRLLWPLGNSPWLLHWVNVVIHAVCAALLASFVHAVTQRRKLAWLSGLVYVSFALLTEAVSGVVGLADMLGALFMLLALHALARPLYLTAPLVFLAVLLGLFSKESELVAIPLVCATAVYVSRSLHSRWSLAIPRGMLALVGSVGALVIYTLIRRRYFPVELPAELAEPLKPHAMWWERGMHAFLRWFRQPRLPSDPMNNPLVLADLPHRVAGALRVYAAGLGQLVFPLRLSGDYSYPAEPIPTRLVFPGSVMGALGLLLPPVVSILGLPVVMVREWRTRWRRRGNVHGAWGQGSTTGLDGAASVDTLRSRSGMEGMPGLGEAASVGSSNGANGSNGRARLVLLGLLWVPVAYFPHSNIPTLLPTVRAERFWVIPAIGAAFVLGALIERLSEIKAVPWRSGAIGLICLWLGFEMTQARLHALDYTDDLSFWRSTSKATPNSAKARLNHAVMLGARQRYAERLVEGAEAIRLAPKWPMARIYQGDTLCRMERPDEAWPHYREGFELGPNEQNLIALALQCLWDKKHLEPHRDELLELANKHPGSWLAYLANDIVEYGEEHKGVQPKYRPRGYNEGPKK